MKVNLRVAPFNLDSDQENWVYSTIKTMSIEEKIGQLFFLMAADNKKKTLDEISSISPGGVMLRPMKAKKVIQGHNYLQSKAKIPLYLAANLECGGNGLAEEGTNIGHHMLIAATDDSELAYQKGLTCIQEAQALGGNMSFAPIIDINFNWENPITNIRSFGDDVERVSKMSRRYVDGVQECGGFVTIKHFPGDGVDGRDQHVIKTINSLSYQDWMKTFGKVYKDNIENGATGLMAGHIAFPAYFKQHNIVDEDHLTPASLSKTLLVNLLRNDLNYNGLIMTDASLMTGFGAEGERKNLVPQAIANGNDMFLFSKNVQEDFDFMLEGYRNGVLTEERINEALERILGLKAKENLHINRKLASTNGDEQLQTSTSLDLAKQVADKGVTLVQDTQNLLPLNKNNVKRIGIISLGNEKTLFDMLAESEGIFMKMMLKFMAGNKPKSHELFGKKLTEEGFEVSFIDHTRLSVMMKTVKQTIADFKKEFDVIIYFVKKDTKSNQTNLRLEFKSFGGLDSPWFIHEIPTMLVSVGNPYHQYDLDNVKTVINGYSPTDDVISAVIEKMLGRSEFKGVSPVKLNFEPFVGSIEKWN